MLPVNETR
jgi:cell division cycle protein 20 (cofactor of APC complex)